MKKSIQQVFADNLNALFDRHGLTNETVSELTGLGTGTLSRIRNAKVACAIDVAENIAHKAFHKHAFELLRPWNMDDLIVEPVDLGLTDEALTVARAYDTLLRRDKDELKEILVLKSQRSASRKPPNDAALHLVKRSSKRG